MSCALALLALLWISGCSFGGRDSRLSSPAPGIPVYDETESPSPAATPTPPPPVRGDTGAETGGSGARESRSAPVSAWETVEPRFVKTDDGVYANKNAEKTNRAVLMFAGDLMMSVDQARAVADGSYDYTKSLDYAGDWFGRSDFAAANLETVLSTKMPYRWEQYSVETPAGMKPNLNSDPTYLEAVKRARLDAVTTVNNHCLDAGLEGLEETIGHLDRYRLLHTGTFKTEDEDRFLVIDVNGIKIALLTYGTGSLNGMAELYTDQEMAVHVNRYLKSAVKRDIERAKERADYVVVFMHWGLQNSTELNEARLERAQYIADMGADYIVGAHPHVLNRYDVLTAADGRTVPCMYSLGNFLSGMDQVADHRNRDTLILRVELEKGPDGTALVSEGYIPCHILTEHEGNKYVVMPCGEEYGGIDTDEMSRARERIQEALGGGIAEWAEQR